MTNAKHYFPTAQVRLDLRIDEGADTAAVLSTLQRVLPADGFGTEVPATTVGVQDALAQNQSDRTVLNRNRANLPPDRYREQASLLDDQQRILQLSGLGAVGISKPGAIESRDIDGRTVKVAAYPVECSVERNSIKDPDTATVTVAFRDLPVDPRTVRSCAITIVMGAVDADRYRRGILQREVLPDGSLVSVAEWNPIDEYLGTGSVRFVGVVDEWKINHDEGDDTVTLTCRDLTALLLDERTEGKIAIDLGLPITLGIKQFIANFPGLVGFQVFFGTPEEFKEQQVSLAKDPGPIPALSLNRVATPRAGTKKTTPEKANDESVWEHISLVCLKLGLIAFVRGFVIYVCEARTLYAQVANGRRMVYGRNLRSLEFARKLGGINTQTIEVRSYDPTIGRTRWARYKVLPGEPSSGILGDPLSPQPTTERAQKVSPSGQAEEQVITYPVTGVSDLQTLERIARNIFEEVARQEIEGSFETDDLDSFKEGSDGKLPELDLLDLQPGESVTILYAPLDDNRQGAAFSSKAPAKPVTSNAQELAALSAARRADYLRGLGFGADAANKLAAAAEAVPLSDTFRAGSVNLAFNSEDGISVSCSFYNYITARDGDPADAVTPSLETTIAGAAQAVAEQ